ncbi:MULTISPECIES: DUF1883 domain-containing protein [Vibrio]|uniref:DUF1883 domain-containing protein n=1 Tax=Vibrio splendidus 12E03 TaxID=1191305 RepID=A0A1E5FME4_VIBSP|nr:MULTISPECIES: DUF1883 domain-containing protein [Vibrio]NTJ39349.1 DUF1883 domain-containing protein [Vibrio vulnificus]CAH1539228.1 conserved hypothetical protein [Vibrio jasicida]HCG9257704.1 DUF1883 domain-containing protein [Vibrio parahaemolyticus]EKO3828747.1 DUF1883 domain-containing protein [Vibrio harveyi]ELV8773043.1 DUF1883 domain-containing protein [Vibrio harveyi]
MKFQHYDLGNLSQGQSVEVSLRGNAANVLLLDNINFSRYKNGQGYKHYGGHITTSLTRLPIPSSGRWHIAIDLGGYGGSVNSAVRVLG